MNKVSEVQEDIPEVSPEEKAQRDRQVKEMMASSMQFGRERVDNVFLENEKTGKMEHRDKAYRPSVLIMNKFKRHSKKHMFKRAREAMDYAERWVNKYQSMLSATEYPETYIVDGEVETNES